MQAFEGKQIRLSVDGDYVNCETNCELSVNTETIGKSNNTTGKFRKYRKGYIDWTMSVDARSIISSFKGGFNRVLTNMLFGDNITVEMSIIIGGDKIMSVKGEAFPMNFTLTNPSVGMSTYNVVFRGTGELFTEFEEFWQIINAMPYNADKPLVIDTGGGL